MICGLQEVIDSMVVTDADKHVEWFVWAGGRTPGTWNSFYFSLSSDNCKWSVSISTNASKSCFIR